MLTHLDLFTGIAGFTLAAEAAGFTTILFVEIDKYCQKVLRKHWPDVPIVEDIRDVEKIKEVVANANRGLQEQPQGQIQTGRDIPNGLSSSGKRKAADNCNEPVTLITGGFPCQPFSVAGKRGGKEDNRYLWPETIDVIEAIKPKWVLLENVTGIINLALDTVLSDLEGAGYSYETLIIPACAVNAPHRRDRVWIVAHSQCSRFNAGGNTIPRKPDTTERQDQETNQQDRARQGFGISPTSDTVIPHSEQSTSRRGGFSRNIGNNRGRNSEAEPESLQPTDGQARSSNSKSGSQDVADTQFQPSKLLTDSRGNTEIIEQSGQKQGTVAVNGSGSQDRFKPDWWAVEPKLGRVAHGIPARVDRLKCLGNAIVPQVAYQILKGIAELELA